LNGNGFVETSGITILPRKESVIIKLKAPASGDAALSYGSRCDVCETLMNENNDPAGGCKTAKQGRI
jgi:hypothetical protein